MKKIFMTVLTVFIVSFFADDNHGYFINLTPIANGLLCYPQDCGTIRNPIQADSDGDGLGDACDGNPDNPDLFPSADGYRFIYEELKCSLNFCMLEGYTEIRNGISVGYSCFNYTPITTTAQGIIEFDISSLVDFSLSSQVQATLSLTVKDGELSEKCFSVHSSTDEYENGIIEEDDVSLGDPLGETCADIQPGDIIVFDVTAALEHDLFAPDQTAFSGFVIASIGCGKFIEFYDHTDLEKGPRLSVVGMDIDGDGLILGEDNCPLDYNPAQEDTFPPGGNGIGDACECEGDLDCDEDQDGLDAAKFKEEFGSSALSGHCNEVTPCKSDFDLDGSVDGLDAYTFKEDFGRCTYNDPCPACVVDE